MPDNSVLVIGLDGATYKNLGRYIDSGELPNISRYYNEGTHGVLESVNPSLSTLSWPSIYTGKNPGKLGVFGYYELKEGEGEDFLSSESVASRSVWSILSDHDVKSGVVNIPVTYPPEEVDGFLISSFLTPKTSKSFAHPPEITNKLGDYKIDLEFKSGYGKLPDKEVDKEALLDKQIEISKKRVEKTIELAKGYGTDFNIVNLKGVDTIQHLFWGDDDTILHYLKIVDKLIGDMEEELNPNYTILLSDHGFHQNPEKYFNLNTWLKEKGHLSPSSGMSGALSRAIYNLGSTAVLKLSLLKRLIPERLKEWGMDEQTVSQIDWKRTEAYANRWGIYLTDERDAELINEIKNSLKNIRDPDTGEKVFREVELVSNKYSGPFKDNLPSIVWDLNPKYSINPNLGRELFTDKFGLSYLEGSHTEDSDGILMVKGDDIKTADIGTKSVYDVTPLILHLFDVPIPKDADGEVPSEIFEEDSTHKTKEPKVGPSSHKEAAGSGYNTEECEAVEEKLKSLGYME